MSTPAWTSRGVSHCGRVWRVDNTETAGTSNILRAVVTVFYDRVLAEPELAGYFAGIDITRLRAHQRAFLSAALGGPDLFVGRSLRGAHAGLGIDGRAFDQLVGLLTEALSDFGLSETDLTTVSNHLEGLRHDVIDV